MPWAAPLVFTFAAAFMFEQSQRGQPPAAVANRAPAAEISSEEALVPPQGTARRQAQAQATATPASQKSSARASGVATKKPQALSVGVPFNSTRPAATVAREPSDISSYVRQQFNKAANALGIQGLGTTQEPAPDSANASRGDGGSVSTTTTTTATPGAPDTTPPTATLTSLTGGGTYKAGSSQNITWTATDETALAGSPVTLEYSIDSGVTWTTIVAGIANSGTYAWTLPAVTDTNVRVRITVADTAGNTVTSASGADFTIDGTAPTVTNLQTYEFAAGWTPQFASLISHWQLNNGLSDSVGANTLTANGGATYTTTARIGSHAGILDGVNDYFSAGDPANLRFSSAFTVSVWIKTATDGDILSKWDGANNAQKALSLQVVGGKLSLTTQTDGATDNDVTSISTTNVNTGAWVHVAASYDGAYQRIYVNGALEDSDAQSGTLDGTVGVNFTIGVRSNLGGFLDGSIDDVAAWSLALTPSQIRKIYHHQSGVYAGGESITITWTAADGIALAATPISLHYSDDAGATWTSIAAGQANSGSYVWTAPSVNNDTMRVRVTAADAVTNSGNSSTANFIVDSTAPSVSALSITQGAAVASKRVNVSLTAADALSHITDFCLKFTSPAPPTADSACWRAVTANPPNLASAKTLNLVGYAFNLGDNDGEYTVYGWVRDAAGNISSLAAAGAGTSNVDKAATTLTFACPYALPANVTVSPAYAGQSNWNDYVKRDLPKKKMWEQTGTACVGDGTAEVNPKDCFHAGSLKAVPVTGVSSCYGLRARDSLGVYDWQCDDSSGTAKFYSWEFKRGKGLRNLVGGAAWKANEVTVTCGASSTSSAGTTWHGNTVTPLPNNSTVGDLWIKLDGVDDDAAGPDAAYATGTIFTLETSRASTGYNLGLENAAIVTLPGATLRLAAADANVDGIPDTLNMVKNNASTTLPACGACDGAALIAVTNNAANKFNWIEGDFQGYTGTIGTDATFYTRGGMFTRIHNANVSNIGSANSGMHWVTSGIVTVTDTRINLDGTGIGINIGSGYPAQVRYLTVANATTGVYDWGANAGANGSMVFSNVTSFNSSGIGLYSRSGDGHVYTQLTAFNNSQGVQHGTPGATYIFSTLVNNGAAGFVSGSSGSTHVHQVGVMNNLYGTHLVSATNQTFRNIYLHNITRDVFLQGTAEGNKYYENIQNTIVCTNTASGINNSIALGNGVACAKSDGTAAFINAASANSSYYGMLSETDATNASGVSGAGIKAYASVTDWTRFSNQWRGFGKDSASAVFNADQIDRCATGQNCRLWDFRLKPTDTVFRNKSGNGLTANSAWEDGENCPSEVSGNQTLTDEQPTPVTFLKNAIEIIGDFVGNEDGLCQSDEDCFYAPNFATSYQGIGDYRSHRCVFQSGIVKNVRMYSYPIDGGVQAITTALNTAATFAAHASSSDTGALTYTVLINPAHGTLTNCMDKAGTSGGTDLTCTFTPTGGWSGIDSFTYKASDGTVLTAKIFVSNLAVALTSLTGGGSSYAGGSTQNITWTATDTLPLDATPISLQYSSDAGSSWTTIATHVPNTGSYAWTLPLIDSQTVRVRVTLTNSLGMSGSAASASNFTIDSTAPVVTLTSLLGGSAYNSGTAQNVTFTAATDNFALATNPISVSYSVDSGTTWTSVASGQANVSPYAWTLPILSSGLVRVRVSAADAAGNVGHSASTSDFKVYSSITGVAVGVEHSCMIINGGVRCWGQGGFGQLGDGLGVNSNTPVQATGLDTGIQGLAVGGNHVCVIHNGAAKCWGNNGFGQLGTGNRGAQYAPQQVTGLTSGVQVIAAAGGHTCAIVNGGVKCWGNNQNGQIGNNDAGNDALNPATVLDTDGVTPLSGATALALGIYHSCALTNGKVKCWGNNSIGQIGINTATASSAIAVNVRNMTDTGDLTDVRGIAAGRTHNCAVVNGGALCWGFDSQGQLGDGVSTTARYLPQQVVGLTSGVQAVSAFGETSCAIVNGAAKCWGANDYGQLGNNNLGTGSDSPVNVTGLTGGVNAIASGGFGGYHTCAIVNGAVKCWGWNANGQVGDRGTTTRAVPFTALGFDLGGIQKVMAGIYHSCAIISGGVKCWGFGTTGALGDGTGTDNAVPQQVTGLTSGVQDIAVGSEFTCAIVNGAAQCWGSGGTGRIGDGTGIQRNSPTQVTGLTSGVQAISAGLGHACAIVNGAAKCWGLGTGGQLGDGLGATSLSPVDVTGLTSGVQAMAPGRDQSCAIVNGAAKCWGTNGDGQVGDSSYVLRTTPVDVTGLTGGVQQITAIEANSCALVNGGVKCWGSGNANFVGAVANTNVPVSVNVAWDTGVSSIVQGWYHLCALASGGVSCLGFNTNNQLGDSGATPVQTATLVVPTGMNTNVSQFNGSGMSNCAQVGPTYKCWGYNVYAELGDQTTTARTAPVTLIFP